MTVGAVSPPTVSPGSRLGGIVSPRTLAMINATVLAACVAGAALSSTREQWDNLGLLGVLAAFTTVAELGSVQFPSQMQAALSSLGLAIAMTFLGPAPAMAIAVPPVTIDSARRRVAGPLVVGNAATYALFTVVGSLAIGAALGGHPPDVGPATLLVAVALLVVMTDLISFVSVMALRAVHDHVSVRRAMQVAILPVVPHMLVSAASIGAAAVVYVTAGLGALAFLLAVSLVSGRLVRFTALAQAREQQVAELALARARLLGEALTAEERERVRLAAEIHDDALQQLALAELELRDGSAAAERLREGVAALRRTLARAVPAAEMRSGALSTALEALAGDLCEPAGLAWQVSVEPPGADEDRTLVCSLARELVTNAVKHAAASRVEIRVSAAGKRIRLQVRDDGRGFDATAGAVAGHVGLALVENRARAADGRLEIGAAPGGGTLATVELAATSTPPTAGAVEYRSAAAGRASRPARSP